MTITVTPDKGFTLETLTVTDEDGEEIEVINLEGGRYSFEMPDGKVSVDATFMEDNTISSDVLPVCRILSKRHCAMQLHGFWTA